jgi:hypothetical protein
MKKALVLSLICALGLGFAAFSQTLSGSWETVITLDLTPGAVWPDDVDIASEIVITYTVGDWSFSSETDILNGVWTNQDFDFAGVLGAFSISGDVEFDPTIPEFVSLEVNASVSIAGVSFGAYFDLTTLGTDLILTASGVAGDVTIAVELKLGDEIDCDFDFNYVEVTVGFPFCCADVSAEILFYCEGFSYVEFCVEDLTIENLPWLTLGACIEFQTGSKVFTWYPEIDLGVIGCDFDLYYRLLPDTSFSNSVLIIDGIQFDGIQIACEIGGVAFTGITYFGPLDHGPWYAPGPPGILYGLYRDFVTWEYEWDFFEAYQIATTDDGCCGPFAFDVTVYFEDDGAMFDVGWIQANLEIQIATQFTFGLGLNTDVTFGNVNDLVFTFLVEW